MRFSTITRGVYGREDSTKRRGVVVVFTVVMVVVVVGFAALTVDVGVLYGTRADLQRAADAGALAAVDVLSRLSNVDAVAEAERAAVAAVEGNLVLGHKVTIDVASDVTVGKAVYDTSQRRYTFTASNAMADAVHVRVRMTKDSANGAVQLYFANIFGKSTSDVTAEAIARLAPRDISVTVDTSGSLNDDSELRHYDMTPINLYDVWAALPQNLGIDPNANPLGLPAILPGMLDGPAWGFMSELGFGDDIDPNLYNPVGDPGLIRLAYNQQWTDSDLTNNLTQVGYSANEITAILSNARDSNGLYDNRVAVALGLAQWNSGMPGGLWETLGLPVAGNSNDSIGDSELNWVETVFDRTAGESRNIWLGYINNYMRSSRTAMARANSSFQYSYGIKTFVNYLLEKRYMNADMPELANTPAQPTQAVKDAVSYMVNILDNLQTADQMSLTVYATNAHLEVPLTHSFRDVSLRLNAMQAGHYDPLTNMGAGLQNAIDEVTGVRARLMSQKVVVMLTDGIANVDADGRYDGSGSGGSLHALALAQKAANLGIKIYTVSVGAAADQVLMAKIAAVGNGIHFHAEGTIDEYSFGLAEIFRKIGTSRSPELIQ